MVFDLLKALAHLPTHVHYLRRSDYLPLAIAMVLIGILGVFVFPESGLLKRYDFIISAFVLVALCLLAPLGGAMSGAYVIRSAYGSNAAIAANIEGNWPYEKSKRWYFRDWSVVTADGRSLRIITLGADIKQVVENVRAVDA
ncbi:MAG: hypothetical protein H0W72_14175 [Planctomycetes bacterium]|nr:hypothetical protein [Planctomycetota bacterium]